jgi:UDP-N-acetylmuramyl pentapeptide synthase
MNRTRKEALHSVLDYAKGNLELKEDIALLETDADKLKLIGKVQTKALLFVSSILSDIGLNVEKIHLVVNTTEVVNIKTETIIEFKNGKEQQ